jgi:hypothetical protein
VPLAAADPARSHLDEAMASRLIDRAAQQIGAERVALGSGPTASRVTSEKTTRDVARLLGEIAALE